MNYPESKKISEEIKRAEKIVLNCHRSPDPDSVSSALAMYLFLKKQNKNVEIVCPDEIPENCKFLPSIEVIEKTDFEKFNFTDFDLFISLDSSQLVQATGLSEITLGSCKIIVIDHHPNNAHYGSINLVDPAKVSNTEVLYKLFRDLDFEITKDIATCLFTGLITDSQDFMSGRETPETFLILADVLSKGADTKKTILQIFQSYEIEDVNLIGDFIKKMKIDKNYGFCWTAVGYKKRYRHLDLGEIKSTAVELFGRAIKGTKFGLTIVEMSDGTTRVSFRTRDGFDVSKIARLLGGDGHKEASAARISNVNFKEATKIILNACKKAVKENGR